jgi:hypothetical protein
MTPSYELEARQLPSGLKSTAVTGSECAESERRQPPLLPSQNPPPPAAPAPSTLPPDRMSHRRTPSSAAPEAMSDPLPSIARQKT